MNKEFGIIKIVKEDILRILGEERSRVSLEILKEEIKVSLSFIYEAIEELEREGLIQSQRNFFRLTDKGEENARDILKKHLVFEDYFKKTRTEEEAHKIAHILEHYVSEEVFNNIKKLSTFKEKGIYLTKLKLRKKGLITNIMISDNGLFERVVSMGIVPGEEVMITGEVSNAMVIKIKNKKFALDKDIAKKIKVLEYGEG
ncbi:MAG: iron dependent repressor, metal binding and dimerization domain protein [Candidatus Caldatribacteriota bacterium]|nr:iron dependent repressor, metal binding and dimerization domain protein [Candidatus Caldatribacteriota bacterium]